MNLLLWLKSTNLVLQVGHVERFNPAFTASVPHLDEPKYIETVRTSGFTFRSTDVGAVLDLMIHDLDLVLSIARQPGEKGRCRWNEGCRQRRGHCQRSNRIRKRLRGQFVRIASEPRIRAAHASLVVSDYLRTSTLPLALPRWSAPAKPAARQIPSEKLYRRSRWNIIANILPKNICLASKCGLMQSMPWLWNCTILSNPSASTVSRWSMARQAAMP